LADWIALVPCQNLGLEPSDPCLGIFDLVYDQLQHLTGNIRYTPVLLVHDNRNQSRHFVQALRLDKTELGQVPAQSIHQDGALADQQIPSRGATSAQGPQRALRRLRLQ